MNESNHFDGLFRTVGAARPARDDAGEVFAPIVEAAPMGLVAICLDGRIRFANREAARLFAYSAEELVGQFIEKLVPGAIRAQPARQRAAHDEWPQLRPIGAARELLAHRRDGTSVPVEVVLKPIAFEAAVFTLAVVVDISARKRLERQFARALEAAPIAMLTLDANGRIASVNHEAEVLYGYGRDELVGKSVELLVPERLRAHDPLLRARFFGSAVAHRLGAAPREIHGLRKDGTESPIEVGLSTIPDGPDQMELVTVIDATERKRWAEAIRRSREELETRVRERTAELARANEEKETLLAALQAKSELLERLSIEDALTGLLNRRGFDAHLADEILRAERFGAPLALAMLDLDRFKDVNDRFGHAIGDAVLREVAKLIRHECRAIDVIARHGGEEFALALPGSDLHAGITLCERVRRAFCAFDWRSIAPGLRVTVSAGVGAWTRGSSAADLVAAADASLYAAKRDGRNCVRPVPAQIGALPDVRPGASVMPR
jgi:diguanylate cyclase (GGDEF)-like protein/PAS domain S-box-containing protein